MLDTNVAINFIDGFDNHSYARFKLNLINDIGQGSMKVPAILNELYKEQATG